MNTKSKSTASKPGPKIASSQTKPLLPKPAGKQAQPKSKPVPAPKLSPPHPVSGRCKFKPLRGAQTSCDSGLKINEWGFCGKHTRTNQAKEAKLQYDILMEEQRKLQLQELEEELKNLSSGDDEEERLTIRPNRWGRFEEPNTGIVFDPDTSLAKGVQSANGKLLDLDEDAIKICIEHGWDYIIKPSKVKKEEVEELEEQEAEGDEAEEETEEESVVELDLEPEEDEAEEEGLEETAEEEDY